jgi:hypothetical protein
VRIALHFAEERKGHHDRHLHSRDDEGEELGGAEEIAVVVEEAGAEGHDCHPQEILREEAGGDQARRGTVLGALEARRGGVLAAGGKTGGSAAAAGGGKP